MRTVQADFALRVISDADFVIMTMPSTNHDSLDAIRITHDGDEVVPTERVGRHGTRELVLTVGPGALACTMHSEIAEHGEPAPDPDPTRYLAASRYVEVDALRDFASERFGAATGWHAVDAITRWIHRSFRYDMWMSEMDDSAVTTLRKSGGMCRDFAHVTIGLCRALGIPARYVSVFAPNLDPPDYHAVTEVYLDDAWWVVDATRLAPRQSMVRIATGIDAEETAWATNDRGRVELGHVRVHAVDDTLEPDERDDPEARIRLS